MTQVLVLIDTCIWASYFAKPGSREKMAVEKLLDADCVGLIGPVLAETLLGFRRDNQAAWVASRLRLAHYIEPSERDWQNAATLGRQLAARGRKLPLTDLVLAAVAHRIDASIYSTDLPTLTSLRI